MSIFDGSSERYIGKINVHSPKEQNSVYKSLLERKCCLFFISEFFGAVKAEQIKLADVNYLLYCDFIQKETVIGLD